VFIVKKSEGTETLGLNVVKLDRVRNALARTFLNLIGLRNVTFISRSEPFVGHKQ